MPGNAINKEIFEFNCSSEITARNIQQDIEHYTSFQVNDIISSVLAEYSEDNRLLKIANIEIDLGDISLNDFGGNEMLEKFKDIFRSKILNIQSNNGNARYETSRAGDETRTGLESEFEMTKSFILSGDVPWWADKKDRFDFDKILQKLIYAQPQLLKEFFERHQDNPDIFWRMAEQYNAKTFSMLNEIIPGVIPASVSKKIFEGQMEKMSFDLFTDEELLKFKRAIEYYKGSSVDTRRKLLLKMLLKINDKQRIKWLSLFLNRFSESDFIAKHSSFISANKKAKEGIFLLLNKLSVFQVEYLLFELSGVLNFSPVSDNRQLLENFSDSDQDDKLFFEIEGMDENPYMHSVTHPPGIDPAIPDNINQIQDHQFLNNTTDAADIYSSIKDSKDPNFLQSGTEEMFTENERPGIQNENKIQTESIKDARQEYPQNDVDDVQLPSGAVENNNETAGRNVTAGAGGEMNDIFSKEKMLISTGDEDSFIKSEDSSGKARTSIGKAGILDDKAETSIDEGETLADNKGTSIGGEVISTDGKGTSATKVNKTQKDDVASSFFKNFQGITRQENSNLPEDNKDDTTNRKVLFIMQKLRSTNAAVFRHLLQLSKEEIDALEKIFKKHSLENHKRTKIIDSILEHPHFFKYNILKIYAALSLSKQKTGAGIPGHSNKEATDKRKKIIADIAKKVQIAQLHFFSFTEKMSIKDLVILKDIFQKGAPESSNEKNMMRRMLQKFPHEGILLLKFLIELPEKEILRLQSIDASMLSVGRHPGKATPYTYIHETEPKKIYIENAGLSIIAIYLPGLFNNLGYLEDRNFKNKIFAARGLYVLQYIATGKYKIPEYQLQFNKLLCGFEIEDYISRSIRLTNKEILESDNLLGSVIKNWKALKSTSLDGFRESFILRKGILTESDSSWTLHVERKGYDVLLNTIPWGLSMIKLPWMKKIMHVEW